MAINTHGLTIKGIRKASGETRSYNDAGSYDEIFYDRNTGEVWTRYQCNIGQNSWTQYHDSNIIKICNADQHMTMQEIADAINDTLNAIDA